MTVSWPRMEGYDNMHTPVVTPSSLQPSELPTAIRRLPVFLLPPFNCTDNMQQTDSAAAVHITKLPFCFLALACESASSRCQLGDSPSDTGNAGWAATGPRPVNPLSYKLHRIIHSCGCKKKKGKISAKFNIIYWGERAQHVWAARAHTRH